MVDGTHDGKCSVFLGCLIFRGEFLEENVICIAIHIVDFKGSVFIDVRFLDGGINGVSVNITIANTAVKFGSDSGALSLWVALELDLHCPVPIGGLCIWVSGAKGCKANWVPIGF